LLATGPVDEETARLMLVRTVLSSAFALVGVLAAPATSAVRPQVAAVRAIGALRVDGVLDEADWARATPISGFRLIENREGEAPSESTEVRVLLDDTHIYFGCRCWNRGPGGIRASLAPRDQVLELDQIGIGLDTYRDRHRAFTFGVNPFGVQYDGIFIGDELDTQWDGVWDAEATRDSAGWTAELAIPLRTLRFPENGPGVWGLWIRRQIQKNDEVCSWPLYRKAEGGDVLLQAADLTGLAGLRGSGLFDFQPYAASARSLQRSFDDTGVAAPWERQSQGDAGLDVRVPLSSTVVLNATLNPDFSQIEADALQIDVNRRYPLQFEEKRPFFLEGADIFSTAFDLIYTRRIANPAYGTKLSGRLGHVRMGGLVVRDDGGGSLAGVGGGPSEGRSTKGWFQLGRAAWEIGENSSVGALVALHQSDGAAPFVWPARDGETVLPDGGSNGVFAADADVRLSRRWFFHGQVAHSRSRADSAVHVGRWEDAGFTFGQDRRRGTRRDVAYGGELDYGDGIRELQLFHQYLGPDFRAESGFLSRVDLRRTRVNSNFIVRPQNTVVRSVQPALDGYVMHDRTGRLQEWWVSPMVEWEFQKQTSVHAMVERIQERWQSRDYLRTVWSVFSGNSTWKVLDLNVDAVVGDGIYYGDDDATSFRGWSEEYEIEARVRPSPRLTAELAVNRNRFSRDRGRGVIYDVWVLGVKTNYHFTRRLYARVYPQYDTEARHLDADALLGYVMHPGSVFYLGYNGDADRVGGRHRPTGHTAFFKVSYLFQR
jgi:hypothetical protein